MIDSIVANDTHQLTATRRFSQKLRTTVLSGQATIDKEALAPPLDPVPVALNPDNVVVPATFPKLGRHDGLLEFQAERNRGLLRADDALDAC